MCGIVGFWSPGKYAWDDMAESFDRATDSLAHRGPDDRGVWSDIKAGVFLGHRRLSIIDLSETGHQPMRSRDGSCMVFNGEIFNHLELRKALQRKGHIFKGQSDTEVLLALYEHSPDNYINQLNGMFAFAIWDPKGQRIILVRDRVGKKPLYYCSSDKFISFASEIKALRKISPVDFTLNYEAIYHYLSLGYIPSPLTIYKEVREVPPGYSLIIDNKLNFTLAHYWRYSVVDGQDSSFPDAVDEADKLLKSAVEFRLRADVPVGVFLSGGIDSGLVAAIAAEQSTKPISTFTISFENESVSEAPLARMVAERYATNHHEINLSMELDNMLPEIVSAYDEPFADPSAIPAFAVARETAQHLKVVLTGDGSDELFGGYRRHQAMKCLNKISCLTSLLPQGTLKYLQGLMPLPARERSAYSFLNRFLRGISDDPVISYMIWGTDGFSESDKESLFRDPPDILTTSDYIKRDFSWFHTNDLLKYFMGLDFLSMLPDCLLVKMDIATMAHSLEARSPFLDHRLVEWTASLSGQNIMRGKKTKPILRALAKRYLPNEIVGAPKRGFEIPLTQWMKEKFSYLTRDLCESPNGIIRDLFDRKSIKALLNRPAEMEEERWAKKMWILMMLGLWDQQCR